MGFSGAHIFLSHMSLFIDLSDPVGKHHAAMISHRRELASVQNGLRHFNPSCASLPYCY